MQHRVGVHGRVEIFLYGQGGRHTRVAVIGEYGAIHLVRPFIESEVGRERRAEGDRLDRIPANDQIEFQAGLAEGNEGRLVGRVDDPVPNMGDIEVL